MKIIECFSSVQGEGQTIGTPAYFIRTAGCNLRCHDCDTKYSFGPGEEVSLSELAEQILFSGEETIVYTGGEPLLQWDDLFELSTKVHPHLVKKIIIETNGTMYPPVNLTLACMHFVVSPKFHNISKATNMPVNKDLEIIKDILNTYKERVELKILFFNEHDLAITRRFLQYLDENKVKLKLPVTFQPGVPLNVKQHSDLSLFFRIAYVSYNTYKDIFPYQTRFIVQQHKIIWNPTKRGV